MPSSLAEQGGRTRNPLESYLAGCWTGELGLAEVGVHQNFFELGGTSLQAAMLTTRLSDDLRLHVPTALLFDLGDVAQVASRLARLHPEALAERFGRDCIAEYITTRSAETTRGTHPLLASLKPTGQRPPLFMVHPPGGIVLCYRELARQLPEAQPMWAIRSRGLHGSEPLPESLEEMAAEYVAAVRSVQPTGPYRLGGWSLGGLIAYEMARQLRESGQSVERLVFLDTTIPEGSADCVPIDEQVNVGLEYGIELTLEQLGQQRPRSNYRCCISTPTGWASGSTIATRGRGPGAERFTATISSACQPVATLPPAARCTAQLPLRYPMSYGALPTVAGGIWSGRSMYASSPATTTAWCNRRMLNSWPRPSLENSASPSRSDAY